MWTFVAVIIVIAVLAIGGYLWAQNDAADTENDRIAKTEKAEKQQPSQELATREYKSVKGLTIEIDNWADNREVSSPLTISGKVPGNWSFEGSFAVDLLHEGDIGITGATARIKGDWMTEKLVPFTARLTFDKAQLAGGDTMIILRKANPSGAPENDDSLGLKVRIAE